MILISIIIPTYNVEKYIEDCIESVLNQTFQDIEIIVVDNNSTDNTVEILKVYKDRYPNLISIYNESNQGAAYARNTGLKYAKGRWVQFLDADDILILNKLKSQIEQISPDISFIAGSWIYKNTDETEVIHFVGSEDIIKSVFIGKYCGNMCSNLWSKKYLELIDGFDATTDSDDHDIMLRLALVNDKVIYSNEPLTIVRDRPDKSNLTQQDIVGHYKRHIQLRKNIILRLEIEKPDYYFENKDFLWHCVYWYCRLLSSYSLKDGIETYYLIMPKGFTPKIIKAIENHKWHIYSVRIMGFKLTETLKFWFRQLFPKK